MKRCDFYRCYDLLLANWFSLSTWIQEEIQYFREDLHDDLARWRPDGPEPDWSAHASRVEAICREGGLPFAFAAPRRRNRPVASVAARSASRQDAIPERIH